MSRNEHSEASPQGTGVAVGDLAMDARSLTREDFEDRHGSAFLMVGGIDLVAPDGPGATVVEMDYVDTPELPTTTFRPHVHPIQRTGRSVGHLVSVGRTSNNDIVIPDVSVSRFHAFLKQGHGDELSIQDAGSTNGTSVNGRPVPAQGEGVPITLKSGDRVKIGHIDLTFLEAELLIRLLRDSKR
jgi:hypothetical protein